MDWLGDIAHAFFVGAGLFWRAMWALVFGYAVSAMIQVFVSRQEAAQHLGTPGAKQIGLAMGFGAISSSCSFAALSATRSLYTKGAHLITALAFMFASTNLVIELGVLLWIFLGWQFVLALYIGAFLLVATMAAIVRLTYPADLVEAARQHASESHGMTMEPAEGLAEAWGARLRSHESWQRVGRSFIMEWRMVWKELLVGFLLAGAVATFVPEAFFETIFPSGLTIWLLVPLHALLGPVLAILTVIGSMGNGPLAAVLWQNGVLFAGILAFLYADFVVPPSLKINASYYGWRFAAYLGLVFAAAAVSTSIIVHLLFAVAGLIPESARKVEEMATFALDYTFVLNLLAMAIVGVLVWLSTRGLPRSRSAQPARATR